MTTPFDISFFGNTKVRRERDLTPHQKAVLKVARLLGGFTDEELVRVAKVVTPALAPNFPRLSSSGIRTRRKELVTLGWLTQSPLAGTTKRGRRCQRWEVV